MPRMKGLSGFSARLTVRVHQLFIDHAADLLVGQQLDLVDLVRGSEAVEEVDERDARLQRCGMG